MSATQIAAGVRHALYGPSAAERWINCPASIAATEHKPSPPNQYAALGSFAHSIAALCLETETEPADYLGGTSADFADELQDDIDAGFTFTWEKDHAEALALYTGAVRERIAEIPGAVVMIEKRVDLSDALGIKEQFGTADAIIVDQARKHCHVDDLKFGTGERVDADDNWQLILYALGVLMYLAQEGIEIETVELTIHQPRLNHVSRAEYKADEIYELGDFAAERAQRAETIRQAGIESATADDYGPGEKACRWCTHMGHCEAAADLTRDHMGLGEIVFQDLTLSDASERADEATGPADEPADEKAARLSMLLQKLDYVDLWSKSIRAAAYKLAMQGEQLPQWKLVEGRKGSRKWSDPETAGILLETLGLDNDTIYTERALRSPAKIIDALDPANFDPDDYSCLLDLVDQDEGKPTLAHITDNRPAFEFESLADKMKPIED